MRRATVIITLNRKLPGTQYLATLMIGFRTKYSRRTASHSPAEAAAEACQMVALHGSKGCDVVAPDEVVKLIPEHLRSIK